MSQTETTSERPRLSLGKRIGLALAALLAGLLVLGFVMQPSGGQAALEQAIAALDESDPDWRLEDIERTRATVPEGENSARVAVRAVDMLPKDWGKTEEALGGKVHRTDRAAPVRLSDEEAALLNAALARAAPAVAEARKLAGLPRGRFHITFKENPIATLLPDHQKARQAASLLQLDALRRAHEKDFDGALASCRAMVNAGRTMGDDPFVVSLMIRGACVVTACNTIGRVLAQGEASDDALAELLELLEDEARHPTLRIALRGERGVQHDLYTKLEDGTLTLKKIMDELKMAGLPEDTSLRVRLFGFSKARLRREHLRMLELMNRAIEMTRLPPGEQLPEEAAVDRDIKAAVQENFLLRIFPVALRNFSDNFRRKQAHVRSLLVLLAAERYRLKHGAWPEKAETLVPAWLKEVPEDPYDGKPIRYRKLADGVIAYAVGLDGKDDGGQIDRPASSSLPRDIGHRLWDVKARGQQPKLALPGGK